MTDLRAFANTEIADRIGSAGNVLTLDIETSPTTVYTFDMAPNWISPDKIIEPSHVMCFAAKWYHEPDVIFWSTHHHDKENMVRAAWELLDKADVLVTFNGVKFDVKHLKREFVLAGYPMPRPWKNVDLYREAKKQWAFESKGLAHLAQRFELGSKEKHEGFDLWRLCLAGDKDAWERMKAYNVQDVVLTEAVYDRMRGWIPTHPHMGPIDAEDVGLLCNQCGSDELAGNGLKRAQIIDYRLYRCQNCGANVQGSSHARAARTRGAL
jgi:hypothetical protein